MFVSLKYLCRAAVKPLRVSEARILIRGLSSPVPEMVAVKNSKGVLVQTTKQNANLEMFYRAQGVCASEEEYGAFFSAARRGLPSVFRVLSDRPEHQERSAIQTGQ